MKILCVTTLKKDMVKVWLCQQTSFIGSLIPPADLVSVASTLEQDGHGVRVLDLRLYKRPLEVYKETLREYKPDAMVLNLATPTALSDYEIVKITPAQIKKIAFGSHAIALPEEAFKNGFDYVLYGDPEKALKELIRNNLDAQRTEGVSTPDSTNQNLALFENLDCIPYLNLGLIDLRRYSAPYINRGTLFTVMLSSRGCPYQCTYCLNPVFFSKRYRTQSPLRIVNELQFLNLRFGVGEVVFLDATFNINESRVIKFCEEMLKRDLKVKWSCNMRVEPASLEMLRLMKKAGCKRVMYGVEDIELLEDIKKDTTSGKIFDAFANSRKAGLSSDAYVMLFPNSKQTSEARYANYMLKLLKRLDADAFQCNIAIPFPGSELFDSISRTGKLKKNWSLYNPGGYQTPYHCELNLGKVKRMILICYPFLNFNHLIKVFRNTDFRNFWIVFQRYAKNFLGELR